jgi:RNA recognition motif-containing protein
MAKEIYVGNLSVQVTEDDLKKHFEEVGPCAAVKIITDKFTGKSKGFGFVEMENESDIPTAIEKFNGTEMSGRTLTVNEARPRQERPGSGRGRGRF